VAPASGEQTAKKTTAAKTAVNLDSMLIETPLKKYADTRNFHSAPRTLPTNETGFNTKYVKIINIYAQCLGFLAE
jgi:hypothetical protein